MGGNEGELEVAVSLFRWRRRGDRGGGARPAGGGAVLGFGAGGRIRPVAGWAVMVGWASREAEAQWGRGGKIGRLEKKLGRKAGWAESDGENSFPNKI
jgi:hypothetical protein